MQYIKNTRTYIIDSLGEKTYEYGTIIYSKDGNIYLGMGIGISPIHLASKDPSSGGGDSPLPDPTSWEIVQPDADNQQWVTPIANKDNVLVMTTPGKIAQRDSAGEAWRTVTPTSISTRAFGQTAALSDGTIIIGEPITSNLAQNYLYEMNPSLKTWQTINQATASRNWIFIGELSNGTYVFCGFTQYGLVRKSDGTYLRIDVQDSPTMYSSGITTSITSTVAYTSTNTFNLTLYNSADDSWITGCPFPSLLTAGRFYCMGYSKALNKSVFLFRTTTSGGTHYCILKDESQPANFTNGWEYFAIPNATVPTAPLGYLVDNGNDLVFQGTTARNPTRINLTTGDIVTESTTIVLNNNTVVFNDGILGVYGVSSIDIRQLDGSWENHPFGVTLNSQTTPVVLNNKLYFGISGNLITCTINGEVNSIPTGVEIVPNVGNIAPDGTVFFGTYTASGQVFIGTP